MALPSRTRESQPRQKKVRDGDDVRYLAALRRLDCPIYPGERPVQSHHLLKVDDLPKGMSRKHLDRWCIPLSKRAHDELHWACKQFGGNEEAYLADKGIDGRGLAETLWSTWNNKPRERFHKLAIRVVFRAHQSTGLKETGT